MPPWPDYEPDYPYPYPDPDFSPLPFPSYCDMDNPFCYPFFPPDNLIPDIGPSYIDLIPRYGGFHAPLCYGAYCMYPFRSIPYFPVPCFPDDFACCFLTHIC